MFCLKLLTTAINPQNECFDAKKTKYFCQNFDFWVPLVKISLFFWKNWSFKLKNSCGHTRARYIDLFCVIEWSTLHLIVKWSVGASMCQKNIFIFVSKNRPISANYSHHRDIKKSYFSSCGHPSSPILTKCGLSDRTHWDLQFGTVFQPDGVFYGNL